MESYPIRCLISKVAFIILLILSSNAFGQRLNFLIPDAVVSQYGGSIGFISGGISYDVFRSKRGSFDLTYGHVPEAKGGPLDIFAAKFTYKPFRIKLKDYGAIYLANPAAFVSYTPGDKFQKWSTTQYPKGYYWWSKAYRMHLGGSTELKLNAKKILPKTGIEAIGIYSEVNTNDLYFVSWFKNRDAVSFTDILRIGYGVRVYF